MLPFLHDKEPEITESQTGEDCPEQNRPATFSQDDADHEQQSEEQEYLTVTAKAQQARKTTYLLAVFFGIGLLCLWFMVKKSAPNKAAAALVSTEEAQIEKAIAKLGGGSEIAGGMDGLVEKFRQFGDIPQVQADKLVKNPFKSDRFGSNAGDSKEVSNAERFGVGAETMRLLSIMQSGQDRADRCCMIDDKILYEGDLIRGFKVGEIGDSFVKLQSNGSEIILNLSQ